MRTITLQKKGGARTIEGQYAQNQREGTCPHHGQVLERFRGHPQADCQCCESVSAGDQGAIHDRNQGEASCRVEGGADHQKGHGGYAEYNPDQFAGPQKR